MRNKSLKVHQVSSFFVSVFELELTSFFVSVFEFELKSHHDSSQLFLLSSLLFQAIAENSQRMSAPALCSL